MPATATRKTETRPAIADDAPIPTTGRTVPQIAALLRVGQDRVRAMIMRGELGAVNIPDANGRPSYRILPEHLERFIRQHTVLAQATKPKRRQSQEIDYFERKRLKQGK